MEEGKRWIGDRGFGWRFFGRMNERLEGVLGWAGMRLGLLADVSTFSSDSLHNGHNENTKGQSRLKECVVLLVHLSHNL